MPRPKKIVKRPNHRPIIPIDWEEVATFLEAGCLGTHIAGYLGCCADTLYGRCEKENDMTFSEFSRQKRAKGDSLLHKKQFDTAMEGDRGMLIWLGKNRLDQKDHKELDDQKAKEFITNIISFAGASAKKD